MSMHDIQFRDKIRKFHLVFVFELSEGFQRLKNVFKLTMVNEPSVFELLRFDCMMLLGGLK